MTKIKVRHIGYAIAALVAFFLIEVADDFQVLSRFFPVKIVCRPSHLEPMVITRILITSYAEDNEGTIPPSFDVLIPDYYKDKSITEGVELLTPGVKLAQLPPETVIARRNYKAESLVAELHADLSAEVHPKNETPHQKQRRLRGLVSLSVPNHPLNPK